MITERFRPSSFFGRSKALSYHSTQNRTCQWSSIKYASISTPSTIIKARSLKRATEPLWLLCLYSNPANLSHTYYIESELFSHFRNPPHSLIAQYATVFLFYMKLIAILCNIFWYCGELWQRFCPVSIFFVSDMTHFKENFLPILVIPLLIQMWFKVVNQNRRFQ